LENAMPQERAGDFNQAMMELGALVCLPNGMRYAASARCHPSVKRMRRER
jgi:adenine-specific DNA glycosylase